ncbi:MAG TPA: hypothetical protein VGO83_14520 [Thermoleophilaceae bacterium]|jgi:hypothetical protein|nr:hypothetical protein [Thermoleophilaceae bacterium]
MARVSVEVPAELVEPIRETVLMLYEATAESLHHALRARALDEVRMHRTRLEDVGELARALERPERPTEVSAPRELLHDALYGALIDAGERLAEASNRSWRGELPLERVQAAAEEVLAIDALLRTL